MHPIFDVEARVKRGNFKSIPETFRDGSNIRKRICVGGMNGSGKSTFAQQIIPALWESFQKYNPDKFFRPLIVVEEPPKIFVGHDDKDKNFGGITYRNVAKEHKGIPGIISTEDLRNSALVQANAFLASRRPLHEVTAWEFPLPTEIGSPDLWLYLDGSQTSEKRIVSSVRDVDEIGGMDLIHVRGSETTFAFQGQDPRYGLGVRNLINSAYQSGFLAKDTFTIILTPDRKFMELYEIRKWGDFDERDVYEGVIDERRGYDLVRSAERLSFTDNLIFIENNKPEMDTDMPEITDGALYFFLLMTLFEQSYYLHDNPRIVKEREYEVEFPFIDFFTGSRYSILDTHLINRLIAMKEMRQGFRVDSNLLKSGDMEIVGVKNDVVSFVIHDL